MKYKLFLIQCFALVTGLIAFGQPDKLHSTLGISLDSALNKKIDSIFSSYNNTKSPGVAISVIQNGKVVAKNDYGMASIELQVPISHQTVVKFGYSEAREFISIAAVLMEKDGVIGLNDKVRKYFPELPKWSERVTIWDLLNHRSGFVDEWATLLLMHGSMANRFDKEQFLRLLYTQPEPEIEPGIGYMYSNSDFGLLRLIMEKASGENLADWIRKRIFDRLNMENTRMQKNSLDIVPNRANKYMNYGNGYSNENVQKTSPGGNYYILSCAEDLVKWSQAISEPGSEINVALKKLFENVRMIPGKKNHYVTGHSIDTVNNHKVIIHEGVNGETYLMRVPAKNLSVITVANMNADICAEQKKLLLSFLVNEEKASFVKPVFATKPIEFTEAELKKYEGRYRWLNQVSWQSNNEIRKLSDFYVENGKLKSRYQGKYIIDLIPVGKDLFYYEEGFGMQVSFIQDPVTSPMRATVVFDDGYPGATMEKEVQSWKPGKDVLKKFTGKYYSSYLDYYWHFVLNEEGKMILHRPTMPDVTLEPDGENQFHYIAEKGMGDGFDQWILFEKDKMGKVTGLTVWSARVMHHRFKKL
jgi:CubicO group peptidase (beta-lactamase class C family)